MVSHLQILVHVLILYLPPVPRKVGGAPSRCWLDGFHAAKGSIVPENIYAYFATASPRTYIAWDFLPAQHIYSLPPLSSAIDLVHCTTDIAHLWQVCNKGDR